MSMRHGHVTGKGIVSAGVEWRVRSLYGCMRLGMGKAAAGTVLFCPRTQPRAFHGAYKESAKRSVQDMLG